MLSIVWLFVIPWTAGCRILCLYDSPGILEWVLFLPPDDLPDAGIEPASPEAPASAGRFFITRATWETLVCAKSLQSYLTLCNPMDCHPPGSSVHSILQASILEWVALTSSKGSSWPNDWNHFSDVSCISRQVGNGNPLEYYCLENPMDGGAW